MLPYYTGILLVSKKVVMFSEVFLQTNQMANSCEELRHLQYPIDIDIVTTKVPQSCL